MYNKVIVKVIEKGKYMKVQTNKKYTTIAFYAVIVIAINVLLVVAVFKFNTILKLISTLVSALTPVIVGLVIAFLINPIMVNFEKLFRNKVVKNPAKKKLTRACSVTVASLVFLGIVVGLTYVVVPELINSIIDIFNNASNIVVKVQGWINKLFKNYPDIETMATEKLKPLSRRYSRCLKIFFRVHGALSLFLKTLYLDLSFLSICFAARKSFLLRLRR